MMPIRVHCENCDSSFRVKDTNAGKLIRCPECSEPVRIPKPRSARPAASDAPRAKPESQPDDNDVDWTKAAAMARNAREATQPCPDCGEEVGLRDTECSACGKSLVNKKRKSSNARASQGEGMPAWLITTIALTTISIVLLIVAFAVPDMKRVAGGGAILSATCLSLFGSLWLLKVAADESAATLVMCLLIPCYQLYFVFTNLETAGKPFAISVGGAFLSFIINAIIALSMVQIK